MNIDKAKQIAIIDYLATQGIHPVKVQNNQAWYLSPFREEKEPSFKVNDNNQWIDFGTGEKGDIINLIMKLYGAKNTSEALRFLSGRSVPIIEGVLPSFLRQNTSNKITDIEVKDLEHPDLLYYLTARKIDTSLAKKFCKELHYNCSGKRYFTIAFPNDSGGYDTNNQFFKGCIARKDISTISNNASSCYLFEAFIDFLSYATILKNKGHEITDKDYIILNSVNTLSSALPHLEKYANIYTLLDNDDSGHKATKELSSKFGTRINDLSRHYAEYKDLNDYLLGKKKSNPCTIPEQKQEVKPVAPQKRAKGRKL